MMEDDGVDDLVALRRQVMRTKSLTVPPQKDQEKVERATYMQDKEDTRTVQD